MRFFNVSVPNDIIGYIAIGLLLIVAYVAYRRIRSVNTAMRILTIFEAVLLEKLDELKEQLDRSEDDGK